MMSMEGFCYTDSDVFLYPVIYQDLLEVEFDRNMVSSVEKRI